VTDKTFDKGEKMTYDFDGVQRTGIKLSNGSQTSIILPEGYKVTKVTFWSVTATNVSDRVSYWKEVAGKAYTQADGQLFDHSATASTPNKAEFVLNNVQNELTFTNDGEQQSVVIVLEYHTGGSDEPDVPDGITSVGSDAVRVEYYTTSGENITTPGKGMYIMRTTTADGKVTSRKICR